MPDDAECLRHYADSRDEGAFRQFVQRNLDAVYSAALRQTRDRHLAEDITQKVFVAAAQKAGALQHHPVVAAWLHQATRFAVIDALRSKRRREAREQSVLTDSMSESAPTLEPPTEWDQVSPELDRIVAALGEQDRTAVILRFFGGKSFAEIGEQLHLGENAARMRVERALEKLRTRLAKAGVTSSSAALGVLLSQHVVTAAPASLGPAVAATAFAAPAVGGFTALGSLYLMTSAKIALGFAMVVTVASLALAVHEFSQARSAELALANAVRRQPSVRGPAFPANQLVGAVLAERAKPDNAPVFAAPAHAKSSFAALLNLLENPAIQKQNAIQASLRLDAQYAALFRALNLAPNQTEQFKHLLVEKLMVGFDSMSAAQQQGIDAGSDPKGFFRVVYEAEKAVDTQIASLLGSASFAEFQQYQTTLPARNTVNVLTNALSYTSTPLTDTQASSLIPLLTQYGTPPLPPGNPFAVLNGDLGLVAVSDAGLGQIRAVLTPPQVQALQEKLQLHAQLLQVRQRMGSK